MRARPMSYASIVGSSLPTIGNTCASASLVDIAAGSSSLDAEAPRIRFKTKRTLRYLAWASAVSAAWVVGRALKSRRRSQVSRSQSASSQAEAQAPSETGKGGEQE